MPPVEDATSKRRILAVMDTGTGVGPAGKVPTSTPSAVSRNVSVTAVPSAMERVTSATLPIACRAPRSSVMNASSPSPLELHSVAGSPSMALAAPNVAEYSELTSAMVAPAARSGPLAGAGGVRN